MTCVQLSSNDYKMVRSTCRSAMMKYRSEPVRSLERYFIWPAQLTGYSDEKQSVHIPLLDDFLDDPLNPAIRLQFQVLFFYFYSKFEHAIIQFITVFLAHYPPCAIQYSYLCVRPWYPFPSFSWLWTSSIDGPQWVLHCLSNYALCLFTDRKVHLTQSFYHCH